MIRRFKVGYDVELDKRTLQSGLLSLVGPQAQAVASARGSGDGAAGASRALPPPCLDRGSQREADTHRRTSGRRSAVRGRGHSTSCAARSQTRARSR